MWKLHVFDCRYIVICRRQAISDAVFRPQRIKISEQAVSDVSDGIGCKIIHLVAFQTLDCALSTGKQANLNGARSSETNFSDSHVIDTH